MLIYLHGVIIKMSNSLDQLWKIGHCQPQCHFCRLWSIKWPKLVFTLLGQVQESHHWIVSRNLTWKQSDRNHFSAHTTQWMDPAGMQLTFRSSEWCDPTLYPGYTHEKEPTSRTRQSKRQTIDRRNDFSCSFFFSKPIKRNAKNVLLTISALRVIVFSV